VRDDRLRFLLMAVIMAAYLTGVCAASAPFSLAHGMNAIMAACLTGVFAGTVLVCQEATK
jgi:hypothetical protein